MFQERNKHLELRYFQLQFIIHLDILRKVVSGSNESLSFVF